MLCGVFARQLPICETFVNQNYPHSDYKKTDKEIPAHDCAGISVYIVECGVPNYGKDDSNEKEDKSSHKNTAVAMLFGTTELPGTIVGIAFVPCSAHRDKGQHNIPEDKSDTNKCPFTTDVHHASKKRHQNARDEESV